MTTRMVTRVVTARVQTLSPRRSASPVMTSWVVPDNAANIARAASSSRGLPRMRSPKTTTVSAARTRSASTDAAFASAEVVEDTSDGLHDTLLAACDRYRYEKLGCAGYHDNCTDNLAAALAELSLVPPETPSPWNLFMNIPVGPDNTVSFEPPACRPGDYVTIRAEMDCVIAFSACPQDVVPINGLACTPTEAHYQLL